MTNLNFFETIFKRKSVRKYNLSSLDDEMLSEIKTFVGSVGPLYENIKTEIRFGTKSEIYNLSSVKAPHYLVMTSEKTEGYLTNAGFMLQQVDLFLSSRGIGSCYLGMALPTKTTKKSSEYDFVMVLAFGNPAEAVHRSSVSEFKRKQLSEITNIANSDKLLEPVRLAPSATNSQPWYFTGGDGIIHAYCFKANLLKAFVYDKMNKVDMGIALCHMGISAEQLGKKMEFVQDKVAEENHPKGHYYIGTVILK
jgi:hypothetical protein